MAVTGPYVRISNVPGDRLYSLSYRGGRVIGKPLPHRKFVFKSFRIQSGIKTVDDVYQDIETYWYGGQGLFPNGDFLYRQAYDRLVSKAHGKAKASVGVTLVELQQSLSMIERRAAQMYRFSVALRKRDFGGILDSLGLATHERKSRGLPGRKVEAHEVKRVWDKQAVKPSSFANNYLEFVFGWKPLVQDIQDACKVLGREFNSITVKGAAKDEVAYGYGSSFSPVSSPESLSSIRQLTLCKLQTSIRVTNPNTLLASELGLINPVQVAWQVVPYSFLIDWFIPIGRYLESYSDFAGLELVNPFMSRLVVRDFKRTDDYRGVAGRGVEEFQAKGYNFERSAPVMFSVPTLASRVQLPIGNLLGKAASSVALLVQQLTKGK